MELPKFNILQSSFERISSISPLYRLYLAQGFNSSFLPYCSKCVMDKFAVIVDAAVDVLHEIHRVEDDGTHTEYEKLIIYLPRMRSLRGKNLHPLVSSSLSVVFCFVL